MLPKVLKKNNLENILAQWCTIKNETFNGQAGLQLSINTTDEEKRNYMFCNRSHSLKDISLMARYLPPPVGRKYCLNFAITSSDDIDANKLAELFDPMGWMVKITPIHNNDACKENGFKTENGYCSYEVYREAENNLIEAGFDVIVFVPSMDEENGTITCGNAILGGSKIKL
jgi:23S rRNA (adenine2503-C2)-methyltransferase